jgi:predicted dienelactone hydrolase
MKNTPMILIVLTLLLSCCQPKEKTFRIGQQSVTFVDESRDRPLLTEIWHPTLDTLTKKEPKENQKALFKTIETIPNASIPNEKFPLPLISHGTGRTRFSLTWFIERMVKEGYIVASLDHYGNSTFNKIPREFVKWWERAIDVQFILTNILNEDKIGKRLIQQELVALVFL